jgi:hypothetical protein
MIVRVVWKQFLQSPIRIPVVESEERIRAVWSMIHKPNPIRENLGIILSPGRLLLAKPQKLLR